MNYVAIFVWTMKATQNFNCLPNELAEDFKLACIQLGVKPSEKLRDLMTFF